LKTSGERHPNLTALALSAQLREGRTGFSATLHQQLLNPKAATPSFMVPKLPEYFTVTSYSSIKAQERFMELSYPGNLSIGPILEALRRNPMFSSVQEERPLDISAVPNDTFYGSNQATPIFNRLNFASAWDLTKGRVLVGVFDSGLAAQGLRGDPLPRPIHPDFQKNFRQHLSLGVVLLENEPTASPTYTPVMDDLLFVQGSETSGHGTHVEGLIAADTNNATGVSGSCWGCGLVIARRPDLPTTGQQFVTFGPDESAVRVLRQGVAVYNRSGARLTNSPDANIACNYANPNQTQPDLLCPLLIEALNTRVVMVVSAGNNNNSFLPYPANQPGVIAVGGVAVGNNSRWSQCAPGVTTEGCGSNYGASVPFPTQKLSVIAPAVNALSSFSNQGVWTSVVCEDAIFGTAQYDFCTGTSMSAPIVTGLAALIRSIQPNLDPGALEFLIERTASNNGVEDLETAFGVPNAPAAVQKAIGTLPVEGTAPEVVLRNRLIPLLHYSSFQTSGLSNSINCANIPLTISIVATRPRDTSSPTLAHLQTTSPQVATGAVTNQLYLSAFEIRGVDYSGAGAPAPCLPPGQWGFQPVFNDNGVIKGMPNIEVDGLSASQPEILVPTAKMYFFSTDRVMPNETDAFGNTRGFNSVPLLPVYRLSFDSPWPAEVARNTQADICPGRGRDFAYVTSLTSSDATHFLTQDFCPNWPGIQSYRLDMLEGYVLQSCPFGASTACDGTPAKAGLECVRARGTTFPGDSQGGDWALMLNSQTPGQAGAVVPPHFSSHTRLPPSGGACIGFAPRNQDTDNDELIDGIERMIGTSATNADTDGDGLVDGEEYPPEGFVQSNPLSAPATPKRIFTDGFEG
jgi:subtilisin family serine protease